MKRRTKRRIRAFMTKLAETAVAAAACEFVKQLFTFLFNKGG